jgi:hypothetical protein
MVSVLTFGGFTRLHSKRLKQEAAMRARALEPFMRQVADLTPSAAAAELNRRQIRSLKGGPWSATMVGAIRRRLRGK